MWDTSGIAYKYSRLLDHSQLSNTLLFLIFPQRFRAKCSYVRREHLHKNRLGASTYFLAQLAAEK